MHDRSLQMLGGDLTLVSNCFTTSVSSARSCHRSSSFFFFWYLILLLVCVHGAPVFKISVDVVFVSTHSSTTSFDWVMSDGAVVSEYNLDESPAQLSAAEEKKKGGRRPLTRHGSRVQCSLMH